MRKPADAAAESWNEGDLTFAGGGSASSAEKGRDGDDTRTPSFQESEGRERTASSVPMEEPERTSSSVPAEDDDVGEEVPAEMPGRRLAMPSFAAAASSLPGGEAYALPTGGSKVNSFAVESDSDDASGRDPLNDVLSWLGWADVVDAPPPQFSERYAYPVGDADLDLTTSTSSSSTRAIPLPANLLWLDAQRNEALLAETMATAERSRQDDECVLLAQLSSQGLEVSPTSTSAEVPSDANAATSRDAAVVLETPEKAVAARVLSPVTDGSDATTNLDGLLEREGAEDAAIGRSTTSLHPTASNEVAEKSPDYCSRVASDEDERARPSPYVMGQPSLMMHPLSVSSTAHKRAMPAMGGLENYTSGHVGLGSPEAFHHGSSSRSSPMDTGEPTRFDCEERDEHLRARDAEEAEWLARKRLTGAIGRLVRYRENQDPRGDILELFCTRNGRITVTALCKDGPASRAGVCMGDQLVSVDGVQNFQGLTAEAVRNNLRAPANLVFLGFAGKLQAEVRVRQPDQPRCGLPIAADVALCSGARILGTDVKLCDTVVFKQASTSSLLLEVPPSVPKQKNHGARSEPPTVTSILFEKEEKLPMDSAQATQATQARTNSRVYELQRDEAQRLLKRALKQSRSPSSTKEESSPHGYKGHNSSAQFLRGRPRACDDGNEQISTLFRLPPSEGLEASSSARARERPPSPRSRELSPANSLVGM